MKTLVLAMTLAALATPALAQDEKAITMDQAPPAARDAATKAVEGISFEKVQIDSDEGTETYEFAGKTADGVMIEVDVLADGTIEEIEQQIDASALPAEVKTTLDHNLPSFKPTMVEKSTRPNNAVVYELEGSHEGKDVDVEINADGSGYKLINDMAG